MAMRSRDGWLTNHVVENVFFPEEVFCHSIPLLPLVSDIYTYITTSPCLSIQNIFRCNRKQGVTLTSDVSSSTKRFLARSWDDHHPLVLVPLPQLSTIVSEARSLKWGGGCNSYLECVGDLAHHVEVERVESFWSVESDRSHRHAVLTHRLLRRRRRHFLNNHSSILKRNKKIQYIVNTLTMCWVMTFNRWANWGLQDKIFDSH